MKKQLFILAMGGVLLALSACSNDETVAVNQGDEISFRPLVTGVTRSTAGPMTTWTTDDEFNVYANFYDASVEDGYKDSKYFQANFKKQNSGGFTSTQKYYWPVFNTGDKMTFTAIYGGTQKDGTPGKVEAFSPNSTATNQMDLMVARKELTAKESPVVLNFRHALSQVVVKVKNSDANLDFDVKGVCIGYVNTTGEFNYDYNYTESSADVGAVTTTQETSENAAAGTLTPTNPQALVKRTNWNLTAMTGEAMAENYKYSQTWTTAQSITSTISSATSLTSFVSWLLIPQTQNAATAYSATTQGTANSNPTLNGSYIALRLAIYNYNGSARSNQLVEEQWCYWPCDFTWNPGYVYTYTVDLAGGGYQPINTTSASTTLERVLNDNDVIVFSPDCTIDAWVVSNSDVTMP